jgi:hypothetical protein
MARWPGKVIEETDKNERSKTMSSKLKQWSGPTLAVGGSLWIAHYALQVVMGVATGVPPATRAFDTPGAVLDLFLFSGAILLFAVGLLGIGARLRGRSRKLRAAGTAFALIAGTSVTVQAVLASGVFGESVFVGAFLGFGVIGSLVSATLLSIAALRTGALPRRTGRLLLVTGLVTFPGIVAAGTLAAFVPAYLTDELPFAVSGVAWVLLGRALLPGRKEAVAEPAVR